jgi:hypothetical protein
MISYQQYINENNINVNKLNYSIFDFDDNILHLNTVIHYQKKINGKWINIDLSTEQFARLKEQCKKNNENYWDTDTLRCDFNNAFLEFRDIGPRGNNAFLNDVKESIRDKKYGPSWNNFIKTLVNGNLFGIVTTRGHEPDTIRKVVEYIIYNVLNDNQQDIMLKNLMKYHDKFKTNTDFDYLIDSYLNNCYFIGIMSQYFENNFKSTKNATESKRIAVDYIVNELKKYQNKISVPMKIGFSDDDSTYYNEIKNLFLSYNEPLDNIDFYVFNTSNPQIKGGKKTRIRNQNLN